jgi:hypothetical protein
MSTDIQPAKSTDIQPAIVHSDHPKAAVLEVTVYAHSALFYWWPLWVAGYVMALLTWLHHEQAVIGSKPEWFHPSRNPGVIYTLLLLLLILVTSAKIKGMRAALIIATLAFFALLFAHLNWWQAILGWIGDQSISMSLGFYLFSSTLLFVAWFISVFFVDHLSFWRFRPGQVTHEYLGGIVDKSYDTDNMTILKRQDDIFRHWVIGLGSGDLNLQTMGGRGVEMNVPSVLFVIGKISRIQRLIATKPDVPEQA